MECCTCPGVSPWVLDAHACQQNDLQQTAAGCEEGLAAVAVRTLVGDQRIHRQRPEWLHDGNKHCLDARADPFPWVEFVPLRSLRGGHRPEARNARVDPSLQHPAAPVHCDSGQAHPQQTCRRCHFHALAYRTSLVLTHCQREAVARLPLGLHGVGTWVVCFACHRYPRRRYPLTVVVRVAAALWFLVSAAAAPSRPWADPRAGDTLDDLLARGHLAVVDDDLGCLLDACGRRRIHSTVSPTRGHFAPLVGRSPGMDCYCASGRWLACCDLACASRCPVPVLLRAGAEAGVHGVLSPPVWIAHALTVARSHQEESLAQCLGSCGTPSSTPIGRRTRPLRVSAASWHSERGRRCRTADSASARPARCCRCSRRRTCMCCWWCWMEQSWVHWLGMIVRGNCSVASGRRKESRACRRGVSLVNWTALLLLRQDEDWIPRCLCSSLQTLTLSGAKWVGLSLRRVQLPSRSWR